MASHSRNTDMTDPHGQRETDDEIPVRRRRRQSRRFKTYCVIAILIACAFLGYFLFDVAYRAYPAFWQAKIHVTMRYTPLSVQQQNAAVTADKRPFVSRGALRTIPREATRNPQAEVKVRVDLEKGDPANPIQAIRPPEAAGSLTRQQLAKLIGSEGKDEIVAELRGEHELVIEKANRTPGQRWVWATDSVNTYLKAFQAATGQNEVTGPDATGTVSGAIQWGGWGKPDTDVTIKAKLLEIGRERKAPKVLATRTLEPSTAEYELSYALNEIELGRLYLVQIEALANGEPVRRGMQPVLTDRRHRAEFVDIDLDPVDTSSIKWTHWRDEAPAAPPISYERQRYLRRLYLNGVLRRRFNDMIHTRETAWVPAKSDVDQYLQLPRRVRDGLRTLPQQIGGLKKKLENLPAESSDSTVEEKRQSLKSRLDKLQQDYTEYRRQTRLDAEARQQVHRLVKAGDIEFGFNYNFFTNGASTLPEHAGIFSATVGTVMVLGLVLAFSFPVGVLTAIYLEEFAPDNKLTQLIEVNINNLAAVPSILFGLLGLAVFIGGGLFLFDVDIRSTALVAGLTLSLKILPIIIISSRAALRAVPESIRLGALAMGATRWQTVCHHVLPQSLSGILTGTIIGLAQAIGETAPLIIVGLVAFVPAAADGMMSDTTVLPVQIFQWFSRSQPGFRELTAAAILVLLAVLLTMNATAVLLRARFEKRW